MVDSEVLSESDAGTVTVERIGWVAIGIDDAAFAAAM